MGVRKGGCVRKGLVCVRGNEAQLPLPHAGADLLDAFDDGVSQDFHEAQRVGEGFGRGAFGARGGIN